MENGESSEYLAHWIRPEPPIANLDPRWITPDLDSSPALLLFAEREVEDVANSRPKLIQPNVAQEANSKEMEPSEKLLFKAIQNELMEKEREVLTRQVMHGEKKNGNKKEKVD